VNTRVIFWMVERLHLNKEKINITLNNLLKNTPAHQIDQMVYKLYGLTPEEIKIVEGDSQKEQ